MQHRFKRALRSFSRLLLLAYALYAPAAHGYESLRDATYVYELEQYVDAVTALENDYLSLIESASDEERFNLYRNYNRLMAAWLQVDFLQTLLGLAVEATSLSDEEKARSMLTDHAQYTLWELDNGIEGLDEDLLGAERSTYLWINKKSRSLLSNVQITVHRLLVDHRVAAPFALGP